MYGYTPKFDAAVKALRNKLGGEEFVRIDEGNICKSATIRHKQGEHVALTVRFKNGKENMGTNPIPSDLKIIPFHSPKVHRRGY